jgi:hypothetical protein
MGVDLPDARARVAAHVQGLGASFHVLSPRFEGLSAAPLRLADTHFNRDGHRAAGEELAAVLEPLMAQVDSQGAVH